mgnify:CR=1 FL=1
MSNNESTPNHLQASPMPGPANAGQRQNGVLANPSRKHHQYTGKRLEILTAAFEVISAKGLRAATITDMAKKAGVADSIIYHYFKNKEDLIYRVFDYLQQTALDELLFHLQGVLGPVARLGKMIWYHLYMNDTDQNTQVRKSILLEARGKPSFLEHDSFNTLLSYVGILDQILEDGIQTGLFRKDLNITVTRTMIFGLLDEEALICLGTEQTPNTRLDFDQIMALVRGMIEDPPPKANAHTEQGKYATILEAAKTVFSRKGYDATTIVDIAAQAGVAEGTVYEYFKTKKALLLSITRVYFALYKTELDAAFNFSTAISRLQHIMWAHFSIFSADKDLVTVFLRDTKLSNQFYTSSAHSVFVGYHDKMVEVLEAGQKSGEFRRDISSRVFRNLVMGSLANLYNRWYYRDPISPLDYHFEIHQYIDLLCRAVTASPLAKSATQIGQLAISGRTITKKGSIAI